MIRKKTNTYLTKSKVTPEESDKATGKPEKPKCHDGVYERTTRLIAAVAPSMMIILSFGGRPSLVALCFGSIASYILDLADVVEGTVLSLIATFIAIWLSAIWAARFLLIDSYTNLLLLIVLGIVLLGTLFLLLGKPSMSALAHVLVHLASSYS